jgi:hypothetical protein
MSFIKNGPEAALFAGPCQCGFEGASIRKTLRTTTAKINRRSMRPAWKHASNRSDHRLIGVHPSLLDDRTPLIDFRFEQ